MSYVGTLLSDTKAGASGSGRLAVVASFLLDRIEDESVFVSDVLSSITFLSDTFRDRARADVRVGTAALSVLSSDVIPVIASFVSDAYSSPPLVSDNIASTTSLFVSDSKSSSSALSLSPRSISRGDAYLSDRNSCAASRCGPDRSAANGYSSISSVSASRITTEIGWRCWDA